MNSVAGLGWRVADETMSTSIAVASAIAIHRGRVPLNVAVFPAYLLHQTLIILFARALLSLAWSPGLEAPLLVLLSLAGGLLGWWTARRVAWLRPCGRHRRDRWHPPGLAQRAAAGAVTRA